MVCCFMFQFLSKVGTLFSFLILLTPVLSWCFVKHHAIQVYGGGTVCLHSTLLNKSTNGIVFEE